MEQGKFEAYGTLISTLKTGKQIGIVRTHVWEKTEDGRKV